MSEPVKPTRRYDSPRRREQAAATRTEILEAAERLFLRRGFAATTMAEIASEARVALKTVYVAFDTKAGVLRALWNLQLRGGSPDVSIAENPQYREVLEEPDPERKLRLNARNSREGKVRIGELAEVIRGAGALDEDIQALWQRIGTEYHANQRAIVESIRDKRALKRGLDLERAADILWALNHPTTWQLLVRERGWTAADYEQWVGDVSSRELLAPSKAARTR